MAEAKAKKVETKEEKKAPVPLVADVIFDEDPLPELSDITRDFSFSDLVSSFESPSTIPVLEEKGTRLTTSFVSFDEPAEKTEDEPEGKPVELTLTEEEFPVQPRPKERPLAAESVAQFFQESLQINTEVSFPGYNPDIIGNVIVTNIDADGEIIDKPLLKKQLGEVLEIGIKGALQSSNPNENLRFVISTFGRKLHELADADLFADNKEVSKFINQEIIQKQIQIPKSQLQNMGSEFRVPLALVFKDLFKNDLSILETKQLDIDTIREIQRSFQREISTVGISDPNFDRDLRNLFNYVQEHVANDQLKEVLSADILAKERDVNVFRGRLPAAFSRPGIRINPSDLGRQTVIQESVLSNIKNNISSALADINQTFEDGDKDAALFKSQSLFADLNLAFKQHKVIVSNPDGTTELLQLKTRRGRQGSKQIVDDIKEALDKFGDTTLTFSHIPVIAPGRPVKTEQIIEDIKRITKKRAPSKKKRKKQMKFHAPLKTTKLGTIIIHRDIHPSSLREIILEKTTKKKDMLKLAHILQIESGLLMDKDSQPLLNIVKGKTKLEDIHHVLMVEFHKHLGHRTKFLYQPKSNVGGQFLDGFLAPIFRPEILGGGFATDLTSRLKGQILDLPISTFTHHRF